MLLYIVSRLRERALPSDLRHISATIFDGLNNLKEKKTPILGVEEKGKARKRDIRILFFFNTNYHVIDHELFMNIFMASKKSWRKSEGEFRGSVLTLMPAELAVNYSLMI